MTKSALIALSIFTFGFASSGHAQNCASPQARPLAIQIEEFERGVRELRLPKIQTDKFLKDGREILIQNYEVSSALDRECWAALERKRNRAQFQQIEQQNRDILDSQRKIQRQNSDIQEDLDKLKRRDRWGY